MGVWVSGHKHSPWVGGWGVRTRNPSVPRSCTTLVCHARVPLWGGDQPLSLDPSAPPWALVRVREGSPFSHTTCSRRALGVGAFHTLRPEILTYPRL